MNKIAIIGDIHLQGSTKEKCEEAFNQVLEEVVGECKRVVILGDIFHRSSISDRFASVGDLQRIFLNFLHRLTIENIEVDIIVGNHDLSGTKKHSLEFLRGYSELINIYDIPEVVVNREVCFGFIPWIEKGIYYSKHCVGLDRAESNAKFTQTIHNMLGVVKDGFDKHKDMPKLLFSHCDVQGEKVSEGYTVSGGQGFTFTAGQLKATGADAIFCGHIHKQIGFYVGALFQNNFGEEGNSQGFKILIIDDNEIFEDYIELDLPQFKTVEINSVEDIINLKMNKGWSYKIRFNSEEAYNEILPGGFENVIIEKLFNKKDHVSRTEIELSAQMSESELLQEYMKINALPDGISVKEIMEEVA